MDVLVRSICGTYQEVEVTEIKSGTLDDKESIDLALVFLQAAEELLIGANESCHASLLYEVIRQIEND